jgi:mycofactocin precursor
VVQHGQRDFQRAQHVAAEYGQPLLVGSQRGTQRHLCDNLRRQVLWPTAQPVGGAQICSTSCREVDRARPVREVCWAGGGLGCRPCPAGDRADLAAKVCDIPIPFGAECQYGPSRGIRKPSSSAMRGSQQRRSQTLTDATESDHEASLFEEELLEQEVSIDGMCGVY